MKNAKAAAGQPWRTRPVLEIQARQGFFLGHAGLVPAAQLVILRHHLVDAADQALGGAGLGRFRLQARGKVVVLRGEAGKEDYVCDLVITSEISPNEAVGEVVTGTEQSKRIRPGDLVQDEMTFNSR